MRILKLLIGIAILTALVPSSTLGQLEATTPAFGVVEGYWRPQAADTLGVSWDRITFDWTRFQPNGPGDFVENAVRHEWVAHNREVVGMIINTPVWASASGSSTAVPDGLYRPFDSPENYWAVFLRQLIQVYEPLGVHDWIIWNNPDIQPGDPGRPHTFDGDVEDYYRLVKVAYDTITSLDENARVLVGGLVWWNDIASDRELFLKRYLDVARNDPSALENNYYFDGICLNALIHPDNVLNGTTDSVGDITSEMNTMFQEANVGEKAIWITELNASPTGDSVGGMPDTPINITLQQQADLIMQGTAAGLAAGAERIAVYRLYDANFEAGETPPFGLIRFDNSRRPAFDAYAYAIDIFSGSHHINAGRSQNGRLIEFNQSDRFVYVMWSANTQPVDFWIESRFGDDLIVTDSLGTPLGQPRYGVGPDGITVYVVETPPATIDISGRVLISGAPRILIIKTSEPRRIWASLGDTTGVQIR